MVGYMSPGDCAALCSNHSDGRSLKGERRQLHRANLPASQCDRERAHTALHLLQREFSEAHSIWKEATCMQKALCSACPTRFGDYGPHGWGDWKSNGRGTHTRVCKHNDSHTETKNCTFSVAPCAEPAACTECGAVYSLDHDWGRWSSNGNKTHTHTCKRDSSHTETKSCDIREATCADPA